MIDLITFILLCWMIIALSGTGKIVFCDFNKKESMPLRFILAVVVAITHLPWLTALRLGTPAVAVFFFLSGFGMTVSYVNKGTGYLDGLQKKMIIKLFGPYFICAAPWIVKTIVGCVFSNNPDYAPQFMLHQLKHGNLDMLLPNSWYPWALLCCGLVFSGGFKTRTKVNRLAGVLLGVTIYYILMRYVFKFNACWYVTIWAFWVGCLYAEFKGEIEDCVRRWRWRVPLGILMIYWLFRLSIDNVSVLTNVPILSEMPNVLVSFVVVLALQIHSLPSWNWLASLGAISYEYYLCHSEVSYAVCKVGISDIRLVTILTLLLSVPVAWLFRCVWVKIYERLVSRGYVIM